jgi:hypothetical protein
MSLATLAEASRLSKGFISQLESGKSNASLASLQRLSRALEVPLPVLISIDSVVVSPAAASTAQIIDPNMQSGVMPLLALTGSQLGTHYVATIPTGFGLSATTDEPEIGGLTAIAVIIAGSVSVYQGALVINGTVGKVLSWSAGDNYSIENRGSVPARILFFLPVGSPMPVLVAQRAADFRPAQKSRFAKDASGPMRLVAMRAQRLAEQRR